MPPSPQLTPFLVRGSADSFLHVATKVSGLRGDSAAQDAGYESDLEPTAVFYDTGSLPTRRPLRSKTFRLPPIDIARQYFFAQHMYIGTIFAFSDPAAFEKQLEYVYDGPPNVNDIQSCLTHAKILVIMALGRLYSVNRSKGNGESDSNDDDDNDESDHGNDNDNGIRKQHSDHPPGFGYFSHALVLLPDVHEKGSILGVETLAYVGYFLQNMNRHDAAYLYIGIALRMAISLGLHQEVPASSLPKLDDAEREHHRRVWWSIYSLDRILSLKSGRPISILDEDIGVHMPAPLPNERADSPVVVLRCYTELSRILGNISTLIYRRRGDAHTGPSLIATVHTIWQSLNQWEEALPRALRLDPDRGKLSRESISLYLHYYQCIHMTARPLFFHVVQGRIAAIREAATGAQAKAAKERDWQAGLSAKTVAVITACVAAARNAILVMSKAAQHNMVATYGYMDGEHAFSAAIVLALVHISFPTDPTNVEAMAKGLALLRRMGDLGNIYVAARYEQLARLGSILAVAPGPAPAPNVGAFALPLTVGRQPQLPPAPMPLPVVLRHDDDCVYEQPMPFQFDEADDVGNQLRNQNPGQNPNQIPNRMQGQIPEPQHNQIPNTPQSQNRMLQNTMQNQGQLDNQNQQYLAPQEGFDANGAGLEGDIYFDLGLATIADLAYDGDGNVFVEPMDDVMLNIVYPAGFDAMEMFPEADVLDVFRV